MHDLAAILLGFLLGAVAGMIALARWWVRQMKNPEMALKMLKSMHQASHPHWLQRSKTDKTRICPCCGWSEPKTMPDEPEPPSILIQDKED
jgi:hypothetical protein